MRRSYLSLYFGSYEEAVCFEGVKAVENYKLVSGAMMSGEQFVQLKSEHDCFSKTINLDKLYWMSFELGED